MLKTLKISIMPFMLLSHLLVGDVEGCGGLSSPCKEIRYTPQPHRGGPGKWYIDLKWTESVSSFSHNAPGTSYGYGQVNGIPRDNPKSWYGGLSIIDRDLDLCGRSYQGQVTSPARGVAFTFTLTDSECSGGGRPSESYEVDTPEDVSLYIPYWKGGFLRQGEKSVETSVVMSNDSEESVEYNITVYHYDGEQLYQTPPSANPVELKQGVEIFTIEDLVSENYEFSQFDYGSAHINLRESEGKDVSVKVRYHFEDSDHEGPYLEVDAKKWTSHAWYRDADIQEAGIFLSNPNDEEVEVCCLDEASAFNFGQEQRCRPVGGNGSLVASYISWFDPDETRMGQWLNPDSRKGKSLNCYEGNFSILVAVENDDGSVREVLAGDMIAE